jgi:hypothetical protein
MAVTKERGDKELEKEKVKQRREFSSQPPERQQPKRPEGFGQTAPTTSNGKNSPPQRERPDVFVDAHAHVGRIEFHLDDLEAAVRLHAQVLDLLELSVGADARLGHIGLLIEDVQVDALVEVRLDAVENIVVRLIEAIDHNPEIIRDLTRGVGKAVENVGEGVREVGAGAGEGVKEVGKGAGKGVENIGEGTGKGVEGLGKGAGEGVKGLGEGAGEGVKGAGEGVGEGVKETGKGVRGAGEGAGKALSGDQQKDNQDNNQEDDNEDDKSSEGRDGRRPRRNRKRNRRGGGGIAERNRRRKQRDRQGN